MPVAAYVVLRISVSAIGNSYTPGVGRTFLGARIEDLRRSFSGTELRRLAYTFGVLWVTAPFALRDLPFARRGLVLVALCMAALSFSYDSGRILFIAAPVVYVAGALVLRDRPRMAIATVTALLAMDVGYGVYLQAHGVTYGLDTTPIHQVVY